MERKNLLFVCLILIVSSILFIALQDQNRFYYAYSEKISLIHQADKFVVRFKSATVNKKFSAEKWIDGRTMIIGSTPGLANLLQQEQVVSKQPVYKLSSGKEVFVTDEVIVKFKKNVRVQQIEKTLTKVGAIRERKHLLFEILIVSGKADAIDVANQLQESGMVEYAHPNFITPIKHDAIFPNDSYFSQQYNYHNTGQADNDGFYGTPDADMDVPEAWNLSQGSPGVVVAVVDEGVTANHPDLPSSRQVRLNGSNFGDGSANDPSPASNLNAHGNACAGLIAASINNNEGIAGICANCSVMPVRIFNADINTGIPVESIAAALTFAANNGADVISNSWDFQSPGPNLFPVVTDAIQSAVTNGRNGKGCVMVFSASNTAEHSRGTNGQICFPATVDISGVLTVGASDRNDQQADYSPSGNASSPYNQVIDIVAPSNRMFSNTEGGETSDVWTIDTPGSIGLNPYSLDWALQITPPAQGEQLPNSGTNYQAYTGRFGGTSAAAAEIAGLAGLILSVNPNLTQQQVFDIITSTADKVGGYSYPGGRSNELGFGRANACRAVLEALKTGNTVSGPNILCSSGSFTLQIPAPNSSVVSWTTSNSSAVSINSGGVASVLDGDFRGYVVFTATVSSDCGTASFSKTSWVGKPFIDGSFQEQPMAYTPYPEGTVVNYNTICSATYGTTNMQLDGAASGSWQLISASPANGIYWWQSGNDITVYFYGINQTAKLRFTTLNSCGTVSNDYYFKSITCGGGGGGGCDRFAVSPNPSSSMLSIVVPNSPPPCDPGPAALSIQSIDVYSASDGVLRQSHKFENKMKHVDLNISDLKKGVYVLKVSDGTYVETHRVIVN